MKQKLMSVNLPISRQQLLSNLSLFKDRRVLILGDMGLDEYVIGDVSRISPEAPVPVLDVEGEDYRLGLSANVAQNIASLGGEPILVSVIGQDAGGEQMAQLLRENGVSPEFLIEDSSRPTTRKMRVMAGHHHIVRVDYERRQFLEPDIEAKVLGRFSELIASVDIVILQDYAKGVVSEKISKGIIDGSHRENRKVLVDPHRSSPLSLYRNADLMTPNHDESLYLAGSSSGDLRSDPKYIESVGKKLMTEINSQNLVITLGPKGMKLFEDGQTSDLPTFARQVFDVTGAGDTVIATLAMAWGSGLSLRDSCIMSNFAAGVVVAKVGCVPCKAEDIPEYYDRWGESTEQMS